MVFVLTFCVYLWHALVYLYKEIFLSRQVHYPEALGSLESTHELTCFKAAHVHAPEVLS